MKNIKTFENFQVTPQHIFWDIVEHSFNENEMVQMCTDYARSITDKQIAIDVALIAQEHNKPIIAQIFFDRADAIERIEYRSQHRWNPYNLSVMRHLGKISEHFDPVIGDLKNISSQFYELGLKVNITHGYIKKKKDKERNTYKVEAIYENIDKKYPKYGDLSPILENLQDSMSSEFDCEVTCNLMMPKEGFQWRIINLSDPPDDKIEISYLRVTFTEK